MSTVVITGANRGLGLALVRVFAAQGWRVHAGCRLPEKAHELKQVAGDVQVHRLDVTDALQVSGFARALADEPIDLLVNNAGVTGSRAAFGAIEYDNWQQVFAVNCVAPLRLAEAFAGRLAERPGGLIVNISSAEGSIGEAEAGGAHFYRASKAALNMLTRSLSLDLAERGVSVVAVDPGWVCTRIGGPEAPTAPEDCATQLFHLFGRFGAGDSGSFFAADGHRISW